MAIVNGTVGLVVAPRGRLAVAIGLTIKDEKITEIDVTADPQRLGQVDVAVLTNQRTDPPDDSGTRVQPDA